MVKRSQQSIDLPVDEEVEEVLEYLRERVFVSSTSQRELSRELGLGRDYVHQVLRGHVDLKLAHMLRIAHLLGISKVQLYTELAQRADDEAEGLKVVGLSAPGLRAFIEETLVDLGLLPAPTEHDNGGSASEKAKTPTPKKGSNPATEPKKKEG